jgi:hypothetical protein
VLIGTSNQPFATGRAPTGGVIGGEKLVQPKFESFMVWSKMEHNVPVVCRKQDSALAKELGKYAPAG